MVKQMYITLPQHLIRIISSFKMHSEFFTLIQFHLKTQERVTPSSFNKKVKNRKGASCRSAKLPECKQPNGQKMKLNPSRADLFIWPLSSYFANYEVGKGHPLSRIIKSNDNKWYVLRFVEINEIFKMKCRILGLTFEYLKEKLEFSNSFNTIWSLNTQKWKDDLIN